MVENKYILYSLVAGTIAGTFSSITMILTLSNTIEDFTRELAYKQLLWSGVPQEKIPEIVAKITGSSKWVYRPMPWGP